MSAMSSGGISGTMVDARLVFVAALKANASSIILAHNHPSGNLKPSEQDERITAKIEQGGALLDITVLDHLIVSSAGYYSFADECKFDRRKVQENTSYLPFPYMQF